MMILNFLSFPSTVIVELKESYFPSGTTELSNFALSILTVFSSLGIVIFTLLPVVINSSAAAAAVVVAVSVGATVVAKVVGASEGEFPPSLPQAQSPNVIITARIADIIFSFFIKNHLLFLFVFIING